jgi:SAM-dependent methyltransferase
MELHRVGADARAVNNGDVGEFFHETEREHLRTTFEDSPETYDRARPVAPPEVFDDLVTLARLAPGSRIVEIGCGTGQATLPLAERGLEIVGVELGERLAALARRKLAAFDRVTIVTSSFEDWDPGGERFDAVVSVNAFHWLDPGVRLAKSAAVLGDGGFLAVLGMHSVMPDDADEAWLELQEDYDAVLGVEARSERPAHPDAVPDRSAELLAGGHFCDVVVRRRLWTLTLGADEYLERLGTSAWHHRLDDGARRELFDRIGRRIRARPDQAIRTPLLAMLYVARRA